MQAWDRVWLISPGGRLVTQDFPAVLPEEPATYTALQVAISRKLLILQPNLAIHRNPLDPFSPTLPHQG